MLRQRRGVCSWACVYVPLSLQEVTIKQHTDSDQPCTAHADVTAEPRDGAHALVCSRDRKKARVAGVELRGGPGEGGWGNGWAQVKEGLCKPRWEHLVSSGLRGSPGPQ